MKIAKNTLVYFGAGLAILFLLVFTLGTNVSTFRGSLREFNSAREARVDSNSRNRASGFGAVGEAISRNQNAYNLPPAQDRPGSVQITNLSTPGTLNGQVQEVLRFRVEAINHNFQLNSIHFADSARKYLGHTIYQNGWPTQHPEFVNNDIYLSDTNGRRFAIQKQNTCEGLSWPDAFICLDLNLQQPEIIEVGRPKEFIISFDTRNYNSFRDDPIIRVNWSAVLKINERGSGAVWEDPIFENRSLENYLLAPGYTNADIDRLLRNARHSGGR